MMAIRIRGLTQVCRIDNRLHRRNNFFAFVRLRSRGFLVWPLRSVEADAEVVLAVDGGAAAVAPVGLSAPLPSGRGRFVAIAPTPVSPRGSAPKLLLLRLRGGLPSLFTEDV